MKLAIRNVIGVRRADLEIEPGTIALVAGLNFSGKTSLIEAIGGVVCGEPKIRGLRTKKDLVYAVHEAAEPRVGYALIEYDGSDGATARISWPDGKYETTGRCPPAADPCIVGTTPVTSLEGKERAAAFVRLLAADASKADLAEMLTPLADRLRVETGNRELFDRIVASLWAKITGSGWDATHAWLREEGARYKGAWQQATGDAFGFSKAETWMPPGFSYDDRRDYAMDVVKARQALEHALKSAAVSEDEMARMAQLVDRAGEAEPIVEMLAKQAEEMETSLDALKREAEADAGAQHDTHQQPKCPHCGAYLRIRRLVDKAAAWDIQKGGEDPVDPKELKAARMRIAARDGRISHIDGQYRGLMEDLIAARMQVRAGKEAASQLDAAKARTGSAEAIDEAKAAVALAERNLANAHAVLQAGKHWAEIRRNQMLIDATGPTGIRQTKLDTKLAVLNEKIKVLCRYLDTDALRFFMPDVTVTGELQILMGERPYTLLSESEQWRVDLVLQCALATMQPVPLLLIDRLDLIHPQGRGGALLMIKATGCAAVVAMTAKDSTLASTPGGAIPDVEHPRHGLGRAYWMDKGDLSPINR